MYFKSASFCKECLEDKNVIGNFAWRKPDLFPYRKKVPKAWKASCVFVYTKTRFDPGVTPVVKSLARPTTVFRGMGRNSPYEMTTLPKKTKQLHFRLTEDDFNSLRERSAPFSSMSEFVAQAIKEFSNTSMKENLQSRRRLAEIYKRFDEKLAHLGGNLNQAMRRINESAKAGYPFDAIFSSDFMPRVEELYILYMDLRKELQELTQTRLNK